MRDGDMSSGRSLSITVALILMTVYIYREILLIVKRFDGEIERPGELVSQRMEWLKAWISQGQGSTAKNPRRTLGPFAGLFFPLTLQSPRRRQTRIASTKLEKGYAIVSASGQ